MSGMPLSALLRSPVLKYEENLTPQVLGFIDMSQPCKFMCVNELDQDGRSRIERLDRIENRRVETEYGNPSATGGVCVSPPLPSYELEMLLPLFKRHGVNVVVLVRAARSLPAHDTLPASTLALADKLSITFVLGEGPASVTATATALHAFLHSDSLQRSDNLLALNERLVRQELTPERCCIELGALIPGEVAVVDSFGLVLSGYINRYALEFFLETHAIQAPCTVINAQGGDALDADRAPRVLAVPVPGPNHREITDLWIVTTFPGSAADSEVTGAYELFSLAAVALSSWSVRRKSESDYFDSARSTILAQLATVSGQVPEHLASQALSVGWNLSAWHTVISVRTSARSESTDLGPHLKVALKARGHEIEVNRYAEHWLVWESRKSQPSREDYEKLLTAIERLRGTEASHLVFGVARPRFGPDGFAAGLIEAEGFVRQAGTTLRRRPIVDARESPAAQLIRSALQDQGLTKIATRFLGALADPQNIHLRLTLAQYLACESSTAETARALHMHRNTIIQRLERTERLFRSPVSDPDVKLALRIALRVLEEVDPANPK